MLADGKVAAIAWRRAQSLGWSSGATFAAGDGVVAVGVADAVSAANAKTPRPPESAAARKRRNGGLAPGCVGISFCIGIASVAPKS